MTSWFIWNKRASDALDGLGLLALRLWVAQEFMQAGLTKLSGDWLAPDWFKELTLPPLIRLLPTDLNWIMAGLGEIGLGLALVLGLMSRFASLGLLFITYVAVYSVHFDLGWAGWNQIETEQGLGFKIPLMLAIMLMAIFSQGAGRYSIDAVLLRFFQQKSKQGLNDLSAGC